jgi:hypothetical protein
MALEPVRREALGVQQADGVGVVDVAVGQQGVVEDLGEALVEGVLRHDRVEHRVERVDAEVADLLDLLGGGQAAGQREGRLAQGLDLVELLDAVEVVADVDLALALTGFSKRLRSSTSASYSGLPARAARRRRG